MKNSKILIYINGQKKLVNSDKNLEQILKSMKITNKFFAIEVNKIVIPKSNYQNRIICENDVIEVLELIGGG